MSNSQIKHVLGRGCDMSSASLGQSGLGNDGLHRYLLIRNSGTRHSLPQPSLVLGSGT